jgi:hypothetical protein
MAKSNWDISGSGGLGTVEDAGSKRLQLHATKLVLYNGKINFLNSEIIVEIKLGFASTNCNGGVIFRSDATSNNGYYIGVRGGTVRSYIVYRIVSGTYTQISIVDSTQSWNTYLKTRFRIDGSQISAEEYISGVWVLILAIDDTFITNTGYTGLKNIGVAGCWINFDNVEIGEKV